MDLRSKLRSVAQRAGNMPNPVARTLKFAALALVSLFIYWNLPSMRPYSTTLILKTSDLNHAATNVDPKPPGDLAANDSPDGAQSAKHTMDCRPDIPSLRGISDRYGLDVEIEYLKRYVRFTRKPIERPSHTRLEQSFLPDSSDVDKNFQVLSLSGDDRHDEQCPSPLEVEVPGSRFPADVDLSDFIFAISTTPDRLNHPSTIDEWAYWLTNGRGRSNGGKLLLRLVDASDLELKNVTKRLADAGIDAEVGAWDSRIKKEMAVRYLDLVPMLFSHESSSSKKWFVLCDDDTFFTAMNSLVERFKQHDHTEPLYIGTLSEDVSAVKTHGSQAYGGGGVFLSRPLASIISSVHETCKTLAKVKQSNSGWGAQGDILLRQCIYDHTNARLTQLRDLWQLDLTGDASGFYEGGLQPYSVHHFKGGNKVHIAYPLNTTKIAHTCGEDCPYMRLVTADNFIISNGYSVAQYPEGIDFNLNQIERTFRTRGKDMGWNFDFTFSPQRPSLHNTGKKVAWELRESQNREDGSVSQVYIRRRDDERWTAKDGEPMRIRDGIIELVWIPA